MKARYYAFQASAKPLSAWIAATSALFTCFVALR